MSGFRPNVALVLQRPDGKVLIGERSDFSGSWQFPQGGVEKGETLLSALEREVEEELGLPAQSYQVIEQRGPFRYRFPEGIRKGGFVGQEQTCFLARHLGSEFPAEFQEIQSPEFRSVRWIVPDEFRLEWVSEFKRELYRQLFREFWGMEWMDETGWSP